tara:strand:+ start:2509 stop:3291 length:783 start_codon:yes stop_codon:yes gene_type:complete
VPEIKIGIQLASLRLPFKKALQTAARLGACAVEIDARREIQVGQLSQSGIRQIRKMLEDFNLRVSALTFQTRRGYGVSEDLERRLEATRQAMTVAYALGAPVVVNQIGQVPSESGELQWDLLVDSLTSLGKHGERAGSLLAARTGSEEGSDLKRLLDALPAGVVGVDFDPGQLMIHGFSPSAAIAELAPQVLHVHVRDAMRDLARGRGLEVPVGSGAVDLAEILGILDERGYRGDFTLQRDAADDPVGDLGAAVSYLRAL